MSNKTVDLINFVESGYKRYSLYTIQYRAVPHLVDGMKTSQRKILFTAMKRAKSLINVGALGGYTKAESVYHHGNIPLEEAIAFMARDFTGSNNIPLFLGEGNFGSIFDPTISSARYISVKNSPIMEKIFLKEDEPILLDNEDIENPEPAFYVPIIPWVLVNGSKGMAVGYATNILSYSVKDIVYNIKCLMENKENKCREMTPYYKGYKGEIENKDGKWIMYGKFVHLNYSQIEIIELPISHNRETYEELLYTLIDKDIIKGFQNLSSGDSWKIIIKADPLFLKQNERKILEDLGLKEYLNENINVLYDNQIIHFNSALELLKDYYKIRISFYKKRKKYKLNKFVEDIFKLLIKLNVNIFIKDRKHQTFLKDDIIQHLLSLENKFKEIIKRFKFNNKIPDGEIHEKLIEFSGEIISSLRIVEITDDRIKEIEEKISELKSAYINLENLTEVELYQEDLVEFLKNNQLI